MPSPSLSHAVGEGLPLHPPAMQRTAPVRWPQRDSLLDRLRSGSIHCGKMKRRGYTKGRRPDQKRAIVTLAEGDSIEIFESGS